MMLGSPLGCPPLGRCWSWSPLSLCNSLCSGHHRMRNLRVKVYVFPCDLKKIYHWNNFSLSLFIYLFFASEASVCWIGFSRLNVFSAYLIRSWNRVMKFTGLCSLDLKYKWAKHSFCFTPCQIRVLFWACFLFHFNELQLLRVTVKHTQVFLRNRDMQMIVERHNYEKKSICPYACTHTLQCFLWGYFFTIHLHKALFMMLIY